MLLEAGKIDLGSIDQGRERMIGRSRMKGYIEEENAIGRVGFG